MECNFSLELSDLISLTKEHLSQDFSSNEWILLSDESYREYKQWFTKTASLKNINVPNSSITIAPLPTLAKPTPLVKAPPVNFQPVDKKNEIPLTTATSPIPPSPKVVVQEKIITEPAKPIEAKDFSDIKKILREKFPDYCLLEDLPDDTKAKEIKQRYQKVDLILVIKEVKDHQKATLNNLLEAIKTKLKINPQVQPEIPLQSSCNYLEIINLDVYINDPSQKIVLWNQIKSTLQI